MTAQPVVFIIGYGPLISWGVADLFSSQGFAIGLVARSASRLEEAEKEFSAKGVIVATAVADVSDEKEILAALDGLSEGLGSPTVVVFNAGSNGPPGSDLGRKPLEEITPDILAKHFKISVVGALIVGHWAVQHLIPNGGTRTLIFTGGGLSLNPSPAHAGLATAKAGMRALSKTFYEDQKSKGTHVATVTVCGFVTPTDPKWNPKVIAEKYWDLFQEKEGSWTWEIVH